MSTTDDPFAEFDNLEPANTSVENTPEASSNFIEVYSKDDHVNSLQEAMDKYDANLVNTQVIRQKLVDKLLPNVMHMDLGAAAESGGEKNRAVLDVLPHPSAGVSDGLRPVRAGERRGEILLRREGPGGGRIGASERDVCSGEGTRQHHRHFLRT